MKRAVILTSQALSHQLFWGSAFKEGLLRHGWAVNIQREASPCDLLVMWGARRTPAIQLQKRRGGEVCVMERGYMLNRMEWCSVSFGGGLNGRGVFGGDLSDASRWDKHFAHLMQPWVDRPGGDVVLMGQVEGDAALSGVNIREFYKNVEAAFLRQGINTTFREHPNSPAGRRKHPQGAPDISLALARARSVITFNSNSAVDAILAGVPAVAMDKGSMAWDVTGHELTLPPQPDRAAWAHALAWKQWTLKEISSGSYWDLAGRTVALEGAH